jgi:NitT/TauT family transport system substrate-binding protein
VKTPFVCFSSVVAMVLLLACALAGCGFSASSNGPVSVHLGYFPNLTHVAALVGVERGTFQQALGSHATLETKAFNDGPTLVEALFARAIDIGFVGPNPAINGYIKSHGQALRIIAGASSGGALFIVRPGAHITNAGDLANKRLATPQLGNTQDVALRYYLQQHGLQTTDKGGNVQIIPSANSTILALFKQGKIDGAWVPEPWATRLIVEGGGQVFVDERSLWPDGKFTTTDIIVSTPFLNQHPDLVSAFLRAEVQTVQYIASNPQSALTIVNNEIKRLTGAALSSNELNLSFTHLTITYDPLTNTLLTAADRAYELGFLGSSKPDLNGIYDLGLLNQVLTSQGLATVAGP